MNGHYENASAAENTVLEARAHVRTAANELVYFTCQRHMQTPADQIYYYPQIPVRAIELITFAVNCLWHYYTA